MRNLRNELNHTKNELMRIISKLKRAVEKLEIETHLFDNLLKKYQNQLGWPRRSGSPSEVRRFRTDGSNFSL